MQELYENLETLLESEELTPQMINEAFDSESYALTEKVVKGKGDISYIFTDEAGDKYRIQFLAAPKFGKGVVKVYVGKNKGGKTYLDKIDRFTDPKTMISSILNFFSEHLLTPEGMQIRGFIIDLSGAAAVRAVPLMKKIIKSTLVSKVKAWQGADYNPVENRKYIWVYKSTLKPEDVFNGDGVGVAAPWLAGKTQKEDKALSNNPKADTSGSKSGAPDVTKKFETEYVKPYIDSLMKKYPLHSFTYRVERSVFAPAHLPFEVAIFVDGAFASQNYFSMDMGSITLAGMLGRGVETTVKKIDDKLAEEKARKKEDEKVKTQKAIDGALEGLLKLYPSFSGKLSLVEIDRVEFNNGYKGVVVEIGYEGKKLDSGVININDVSSSVNTIANHFRKIGIDGNRPVLLKGDTVTIKDPSRVSSVMSNTPINGVVYDYDANFVHLKVGTGGMSTTWDNITTDKDYAKNWNAAQQSKMKSDKQKSDGKVAAPKSEFAKMLIDAGFKNVGGEAGVYHGTDKGAVMYTFKEISGGLNLQIDKSSYKMDGVAELKSVFNQLDPFVGVGLSLSDVKNYDLVDSNKNYTLRDVGYSEGVNVTRFELNFKSKSNKYPILSMSLEFNHSEKSCRLLHPDGVVTLKNAPNYFKNAEEFKNWSKKEIAPFVNEFSNKYLKSKTSSNPGSGSPKAIKTSVELSGNTMTLTYFPDNKNRNIVLKSNASDLDHSLSNVMFMSGVDGSEKQSDAVKNAIHKADPKSSFELSVVMNKVTGGLDWKEVK